MRDANPGEGWFYMAYCIWRVSEIHKEFCPINSVSFAGRKVVNGHEPSRSMEGRLIMSKCIERVLPLLNAI